MSHRKPSKRRREADVDDDFSPSLLPRKKRSKSQEEIVERKYASPQHSLNDADTGIRRSSRTPKPKVFDDEEIAATGKASEGSSSSKQDDFGSVQSVDQPSSNSKRITPKNDASIAKKQKKSNPVISYDEGHKRETRRSYQNYLDELKTDVSKKERGADSGSVGQTANKNEQSRHGKTTSVKRKSDVTGQPGSAPKSTGAIQRTPKEKGTSTARANRETPDEPSPKVRTSSRTPVPKRVFSLLEQEESEDRVSDTPSSPGVENGSLDLSSPKVRSSSRAHVPKKSFPLLGEEDTKETKLNVSEQASPKTRTPKLQGTKRRLSKTAEESEQNTPLTPDEPSPKIRVSSRGHMPKRTFSLLDNEKGSPKLEEGTNLPEKTHKEETFVLSDLIEQQKSTVTKEPKRRKSNSAQQQLSKKEKQSSIHGSGKSDGVAIKVEKSDVSGDIRTAATLDDTEVVTTPRSYKSPAGRSQSESSKSDQEKGKSSRRKGKPVKKKLTSEETQKSDISVPNVKIKEEPTDKMFITPRAAKPKGVGKKKQASELLGKSAVKQEHTENAPGFSLSDIAMDVIDSSASSSDVNTSVSKAKKKGKLSKNTQQKAKDKAVGKSKDIPSNSDSQTEEHEHIILKLQIPHTDGSPKHKKHHHHHHHHHHHKHKHSSTSHEDGSPKKSHHKKSASKLPGESSDPDRSEKGVVKKKKKISIKFKGLDKDLEKARKEQSSELESSEKESTEGGKKKKKAKKIIPHNEEQLALPWSQSESEHVKLVIKKDKIPKPGKKSVEVKKKKIAKPTASMSGEQKKKATATTESKKTKTNSTPSKSSKSPQKPKTVTSYLLFCKQIRKKIVEENPGLEFTEISKKVGIAWNNLSEMDKQYWRQKAEDVKKSLGLNSPKSAATSKDDRAEPVDLAAHLQLLGESLCTVGACLRVQDPGEVHGSLSVLLDTALCAISPLLFLTSQIPEMNGCSRKTQAEVLDNLAYLMPGLG